MKKILLLTLLLSSLLGMTYAGNKSRLLYTDNLVSAAKEKVKNDSLMQRAWNDIKSVADAQLKRNSVDKLDYLSLAYIMTGDKTYSDKIISVLKGVVRNKAWASSEMLSRKPAWRSDLGVAHKAYMTAIGYNTVYNDMSSSDRKQIAEALYRLGVEPLLGDWIMEPSRIHSLNSMGHNWWTSCVCMGGILALSIQNEIPQAKAGADAVYEVLPEWFLFAGDVLQHKPKTFDEAGGMYESLNYANFGIQEALQFYIAWGNINGQKQLPELSHFDKICDYFMHVCYPRTGMLYSLNFGDSHKNISAESSLMLLYSLGVKDENMLWYISQVEQGQHRDGYFLNKPMGFLYTPDLSKAPELPEQKTSQLFSDFGWATMRTSWEKDATMLAIKSGHTWNHSHADANSFILFHKGVDIIKDAGNCWYPKPEYRNYFFQSQAHNVVLFNGQGQSREQQYNGSSLRGNMYNLLDAGNIRYVMSDGTGPVSDNFSRNFRHFLWMDNVIYMIDDLKTHTYGDFEWLWHPGGETRKSGADLTVTNGDASVVIRPLYPRLLALSDFVHDYPEDLYWEIVEAPHEDLNGKTEKYYSFHLPGKFNRVKGLTAIILKDSVNQKELPVMERREGKDWIGLRVKYNGKVTDLYINQLADGRLMHSNSWIEADGWTTDAYMFAVTYKEGDKPSSTKEMFVCYGSALRRGNDSYFSSMSKLFVIKKEDRNGWKLWMQGQPYMNASFGGASVRPSKLWVNDSESKFTYTNKSVKVRINN